MKDDDRVTVLLCDDHTILRAGLRALLERGRDIRVVAEAGSVRECLDKVDATRPDIVVMDIRLPDGDGLDAVPTIKETSPATSVLILSMYRHPHLFAKAIRNGASGYVLKSDVDTELVRAIRTVREGEPFVYSREVYALLRAYLETGGDPAAPELSPMETEVLKLTAQGLTAKETAQLLNISHNTVNTYRRRIMQKLHLASRGDLVSWALEHGLMNTDSQFDP